MSAEVQTPITDQPIEITDLGVASRFVERFAAPEFKRGWRCWSHEELLKKANRLARSVLNDTRTDRVWYSETDIREEPRGGPTRLAKMLLQVKAKRSNIAIRHAVCRRCGSGLSALDSIAAGIGPECELIEAGLA